MRILFENGKKYGIPLSLLPMSALEIESCFDRLWPICRSLTGDGNRQSFEILKEIIPLTLHEIPSGTEVFDWKVPPEWNIRDAYLITPDGRKVADFKVHNLHVVNYSEPVDRELTWEELEPHVHTLPEMPTAIPYMTSYYNRNWGFCLSYEEYQTLPKEGMYRAVIDSSLDENGQLTYGDLVLPGETEEEIMFSTYICHPSLANNELSGPLVQAFLYQQIAALPKRRYTYRFIFIPETIGSIAYLALNEKEMLEKTRAGYVITCVGDGGPFTYKRSKRGNSLADQAAIHVLEQQNLDHTVIDFAIGGSDERQYCSPGFNLPVGSLTRAMYHTYDAYHTSLDNKDFISFGAMEDTVQVYLDFARTLEANRIYERPNPFCEPQLGKRGLYYKVGGKRKRTADIEMMKQLLAFADGEMSLMEIAKRQGYFAPDYVDVIGKLEANGLLREKREDSATEA